MGDGGGAVQDATVTLRRGIYMDRNAHIEIRFIGHDVINYEPLAKELVATHPDVILAHTTPVVAAIKRETRVLPIVFGFSVRIASRHPDRGDGLFAIDDPQLQSVEADIHDDQSV